MKIAFITSYDSESISSWSGTPYNFIQELKAQNVEIKIIKNLRNSISPIVLFAKIKQYIYQHYLHISYEYYRSKPVVKHFCKLIDKQLDGDEDCILSMESMLVCYLKTQCPKFFYTDANFAVMQGYYTPINNKNKSYYKNGEYLEALALNNCKKVFYSSTWAAEGARYIYRPSCDIKVIPLSANIKCDRSENDIINLLNLKSRETLHILFLGVDWNRKGGDIVYEVCSLLKDKGVDVKLHIVGIKDNLPIFPNWVINEGFLSKNNLKENEILEKLFSIAHYLFVPSKAEAYGVVFCEAASFGLPSLSRKTGGISTAINHGKSGFVLNFNASYEEYADIILAYFTDWDKYCFLSLSAFEDFQNRTNYKVTVQAILEEVKSSIK